MGKHSVLRLLRFIQGMRIYRTLARKLIGKCVCYQFAYLDDASDLAKLHGYDRFSDLENPVETFVNQINELQGCGYILIARVKHQIKAATVLRWFPNGDAFYPDWWLFGMLVHPLYHGVGIGEGLLRMALEKVIAEGGSRVNLLVSEQNKVAINLYLKLGFHPSSITGLDEILAEETKRGEQRRIIMSKYL